jgi:hypothetical protein
VRKRLLGLSADTTPGGTEFDDRVSGDMADPIIYVPIQGGTPNKGAVHRDRNDEVRQGGGTAAPEAFRANPSVDGVTCRPYPILLKVLTLAAMAVEDDGDRTGSPPASIVHGPFRPTTDNVGPAFDATVVRDEAAEQVGGCQVPKLSVELNLDGESKVEFDLLGLYWRQVDPDDLAGPDFDDIEEHDFILRDMSVFLDDSVSRARRIRTFMFEFDSQMSDPEVEAGFNIQEDTTNPNDRVWWPSRRRRGFRHTATVRLGFSEPQPAYEIRHLFAQGVPIVCECGGDYLGTTPQAQETVRWTFDNAVPTESTIAGLSNDDDVVHDITFTVAIDETTNNDVAVEFIDDSNVDIALPVGS